MPALQRVVSCSRYNDGRIIHLSTYQNKDTPFVENLTIWQAARATLAAVTYFEPIQIGESGIIYSDGKLGANNPVWELMKAAEDVWDGGNLESKIRCLVSVGTGALSLSLTQRIGIPYLTKIAQASRRITMATEETAEDFLRLHRELVTEDRYIRFNVTQGLDDVSFEASDADKVVAITHDYLTEPIVNQQLKACANALTSLQGKPFLICRLWKP